MPDLSGLGIGWQLLIMAIATFGGYLINAYTGRRTARADVTEKISTSFGTLVDRLQKENARLVESVTTAEKLEESMSERMQMLELKHQQKIASMTQELSDIKAENAKFRDIIHKQGLQIAQLKELLGDQDGS